MKKQASPAPTSRAAALSQSASRFAAGATSTWQRIAGNSPRLATASRLVPGAARTFAPLTQPTAPGASRVALEPQQAASLLAPVAEPETTRQVGWREADRAVSMGTKRKYSLFGFGFGPKVPVFETEQVKLPVYQETDRQKRYYAVVKKDDVARIKRDGFQAKAGSQNMAPKTVEQFNSKGHIRFFSSAAGARSYGQQTLEGDYAVVEFVLPEYHEFTASPEAAASAAKTTKPQALSTLKDIPAECIKSTKNVN